MNPYYDPFNNVFRGLAQHVRIAQAQHAELRPMLQVRHIQGAIKIEVNDYTLDGQCLLEVEHSVTVTRESVRQTWQAIYTALRKHQACFYKVLIGEIVEAVAFAPIPLPIESRLVIIKKLKQAVPKQEECSYAN